jgi:hypothetical protein
MTVNWFLGRFRQREAPQKWESAAIEHDTIGLRVSWSRPDGQSGTHQHTWHQVTRVLAFKRDLYTYDLLCLAFQSSTSAFEVNEEMEGWNSLLADLPNHLPGAMNSDAIWAAVVKPAFATNETVVYERASSHAV